MLRTGPQRSKADFDRVADLIEKAWYEVVDGDKKEVNGGGKNGEVGVEREKEKKLMFVTIYPMLAAREAGTVIPLVSLRFLFLGLWRLIRLCYSCCTCDEERFSLHLARLRDVRLAGSDDVKVVSNGGRSSIRRPEDDRYSTSILQASLAWFHH